MANKNDDFAEAMGMLIGVMFIVALIVSAAMAIITIAGITGAVFGSGVCLVNYGKALVKNVSLEKPAP